MIMNLPFLSQIVFSILQSTDGLIRTFTPHDRHFRLRSLSVFIFFAVDNKIMKNSAWLTRDEKFFPGLLR